MAASNWAICPRCKLADEEKFAKDKAAVQEAYGKVSEQQYSNMKLALESRGSYQAQDFREDWEIGVTLDGTFSISYEGRCGRCGLGYIFTFSDRVLKKT